MKTSRQAILLSSGLALLSIFSACTKKEKSSMEEETPVISVATPMIDSIVLHKTYPGLLLANNTIDVMCRVDGAIRTCNYTSGQFVRKGQVLFTIENTQYRDAVEQSKASLATAKSQHEYATRNYEALKEALQSDAVSQIEVIQAKSQMEQAAASVKNAEASLSLANLNLSYCTITAPMDGFVSASPYSVGQVIYGAGAPVKLTTLYDNSQMLLQFYVEDAQYEEMIGQKGGMEHKLYRDVPLHFAQDLPHSYTANLDYEAPSVNSSTGTLELRGKIQNPYNELKNGMYVTIDLPYGVDPKAIIIKDASIGTDQLGKYVYVVNDSDKIVYTPIKIGELYQDTLRVVNEGLKADDRYVTQALLSVREGMKVKPELKK